MTISPVERKTRSILPLVRLMQTTIPLPFTRWFLARSLKNVHLSADISREAVSADGVPCEWIIPLSGSTGQVLLYFHGGGFIFGLTPMHLQMGAYLAQKTGLRILMVDYRLAPEYPFPAALEDCATVYRWLLKTGILPQELAIAGDSAGGNLTITLMMNVRDRGIPLPAAAACLSPVTDLTLQAKRREGFKDPLLPPRAVKRYSRSYVGHSDARNPLISPVFGNLRGLPPMLVHVGEDEILRSDAVRITDVARSAGVDVRLEIYPRMWHVWQLFPSLPQAVQSLDDIAEFLQSHLGEGLAPR